MEGSCPHPVCLCSTNVPAAPPSTPFPLGACLVSRAALCWMPPSFIFWCSVGSGPQRSGCGGVSKTEVAHSSVCDSPAENRRLDQSPSEILCNLYYCSPAQVYWCSDLYSVGQPSFEDSEAFISYVPCVTSLAIASLYQICPPLHHLCPQAPTCPCALSV